MIALIRPGGCGLPNCWSIKAWLLRSKKYLRPKKRYCWIKTSHYFLVVSHQNNSPALPRLQRLHNSQSIRMLGAILQITVYNNLPPSALLPSLKQCFIAFFSICICHPWSPLFDLSPPVSASPGSRWPVDWQLRSDIWWDEASTRTPCGQKQTIEGFFYFSFFFFSFFTLLSPRRGAQEQHGWGGPIPPLDGARCKRIFPGVFSTGSGSQCLTTILMYSFD